MTALHIAKPEDINRLLPLITAFHLETGIEQTEEARQRAIMPLLEGIPHGVIYLVGPARAPIGYIALSFGWSLEFGGMDGTIDELFIRPGVRGRGIGSEVLLKLPKALSEAGLAALHLEVARNNPHALRFYKKLHFKSRDEYHLMTRTL